MGYTPKRKIVNLVFADEDMAGLEVRTYGASTEAVIAFSAMTGEKLSSEDALTQLELFAEALIEWNLDDAKTGERVPATLRGLRSQEPEFVYRIIDAWVDATMGVSGPLDQSSADGPQSAEASIPMETLSQSRAS